MQAPSTEQLWLGGFYELAIAYEHSSDIVLDKALQAIWDFPDLQGCYLRPDVEPSGQQRVAPTLGALEAGGHLRGIVTVPNGKQVACGTFMVREEKGPTWLGFYMPMGALATAYDVGAYPFEQDGSSQSWREPLERWLAAIGEFVFAKSPYRLGLVGFEVSGMVSVEDLVVSGVPEKRWIGYLCPRDSKLFWYPTNQWHQTAQLAS
jgi:hypothetical protein